MAVQAQRRKKKWNPAFMPGDADIMKSLRLNPRQTVPQLYETVRLLTGKPRGTTFRVTWVRARALRQMNLVLRTFPMPADENDRSMNNGHAVHYPTRKGWQYLFEIGAVPALVSMGKKVSAFRLDHETRLTDVWKALFVKLPLAKWTLVRWERIKTFLHERYGDGKKDVVNPDAGLEIADEKREAFVFWEQENSEESIDKNTGEPTLIVKADGYEGYYKSGAFERRWGYKTFRVVFNCKDREMAVRVARKMWRRGYRSERWLFTWHDAVLENPTGFIYMKTVEEPTPAFNIFGDAVR